MGELPCRLDAEGDNTNSFFYHRKINDKITSLLRPLIYSREYAKIISFSFLPLLVGGD